MTTSAGCARLGERVCSSHAGLLAGARKVLVTEYCVFGGIHRAGQRLAKIYLDRRRRDTKGAGIAVRAAKRGVELRIAGVGHAGQRTRALGNENDWSRTHRRSGGCRDGRASEGILPADIERQDVGSRCAAWVSAKDVGSFQVRKSGTKRRTNTGGIDAVPKAGESVRPPTQL